MKLNLAKYFPISSKQLEDFSSMDGNIPNSAPPEDGLKKVIAAKNASIQLEQYRQLKETPTSFGQIVELVAAANGDNRFGYAGLFKIDPSKWRSVILNSARPDSLPARIYAGFAKQFQLPFALLKKALLGSFHLVAAGGSGTSPVYTRSTSQSSLELSGAIEELLQKASPQKGISSDPNVIAFLQEVQSCMA